MDETTDEPARTGSVEPSEPTPVTQAAALPGEAEAPEAPAEGAEAAPSPHQPDAVSTTLPGVPRAGRHRGTGRGLLRAAWPGGRRARPALDDAPEPTPDAEAAPPTDDGAAPPTDDGAAPPTDDGGTPHPDDEEPEAPPRTPLRSRPSFGLVLTGVFMAALLGAGGAAGAVVVPKTAGHPVAGAHPSAEDPSGGARPGSGPLGGDGPDDLFPDPGSSGDQTGGYAGERPSDALAAWAIPLAAKVGIPATAMQAYGYAELVLAQSTPSCRLSWTTLAGIGKIESDHGRAGGASLGADGKSLPPIIGPALDGTRGMDAIPDTDGGQLDGDRVWDHAVGPMQFIPSSWQRYAVDADNDGVSDPNDIDDAALAAASYLCASGRDLSTAAGWNAAILTYNAVRVYAADVFAAANTYGLRSRD